MASLTVESHDLTEKFEAEIFREYGVTVKNRMDEPWCVVFEGARDQLIRMFNTHWGDDDPEQALEVDSPWLSDD
jgi:hypothetical protein